MNDMTLNLADEATVQRLAAALALQRKAYLAHPVPTLDERRTDLRTLQRFVRDHKEALISAISADYGHRSRHETLLAEIAPAIDGIEHTLKHLKAWMKPQKRGVDWISFFGARNRVIPQPLGVVGVIVPWNFPVNLSLIPLNYIFAAGNRAMVKMSENSRHLARLLIEKMPAYFPPEKLQFFDETGGVGIEFSKLPFDHLLFTGSGTTGRAVMAAAARNLCPVTLELGGKSPAIVFDDYPIRTAAERILFAKLLNAGQICTTVDHVWLPQPAASTSSCNWRVRSCRSATRGWSRPTTPRSSTSAPSTGCCMRWTRRASAAPRWCSCSAARRTTGPRARSRRTSCSTRPTTAC